MSTDQVTQDRLVSLINRWQAACDLDDSDLADRLWSIMEDTIMEAEQVDQVDAREIIRDLREKWISEITSN